MDAPELHIRGDGGEELVLSPTRRLNIDCDTFWDANWLSVSIHLRVGAFRADYEAQVHTLDLQRLGENLRALHEELTGTARFRSLEDWLRLDFTGDGMGHIRAKCVARDQPGGKSTLNFELEFDQTVLATINRELDAMLRAFPVLGAEAT